MAARARTRSGKRRWPWFGAGGVGLLAAGVAIGAWVLPAGAQTTPTTTTRTVTASLETLQKTVTGAGTVAPATNDAVAFAVSGTVAGVAVQAGQTVTAGQTLATLDPVSLNAAVLSARATLAQAQADLVTAQNANTGTSAAVAKVAAAQGQVQVAQQSVTQAQTALGEATLTAPAAGQIAAVNVAVGDKVGGGSGSGSGSGNSGGSGSGSSSASSTAAFTLVSTDAWTVTIPVGEADIAKVAQGQQVDLTDASGGTWFGTVSAIALLPSTTSGAAEYPVTVQVTGDGKGLHDGVSLTAAIVYERRDGVLTVPTAAIRTDGGTSNVEKVGTDGKAVATTVTVGEADGTLTEITKGLAEGDQVQVTLTTPTARTGNGSGTRTGGAGGFGGGGFGGGGTGGGGERGGGQGTGGQGTGGQGTSQGGAGR